MPEIDLVSLIVGLAAGVTMPGIVMLWSLWLEDKKQRDFLQASKVWELKADRFLELVSELYELVDVATFRSEIRNVSVEEDCKDPFGTILTHSLDLIHAYPEVCEGYQLPRLVNAVLDTPMEKPNERAKKLNDLRNVAMVVSQRAIIRGCEDIQRSRGRLNLFLEDAEISFGAKAIMLVCWNRFHGKGPECEMDADSFTAHFVEQMDALQMRMRTELASTLQSE